MRLTQRATLLAATATAAAAVLAATGTASAAPSVSAAGQSGRDAAVSRAVALVAAHAAELGYSSAQGLAVRDVLIDRDGTQHVRFDRTYRGLSVLGGDLVVHSARGGAYLGADRASQATISVRSLRPSVSAARAADIAADQQTDGRATTSSPRLVVDAAQGAPALAWESVVKGTRADRTPSELHVVVDATTGAVRYSWDAIETGVADDTGFFVGTVDLTTTLSGGTYQLKDPSRGNNYTTDMNNGTTGNGTLFTDADDIWGNGTLTNRQTVAVDAQYGVAETWDYYLNVHGRNGIANDGKGAYNRVHYDSGYNNAFWSDSCFCMTYGDGDGTSFNPFTELDVAGHEMSHGVTSRTAGLSYRRESGGLNESTSDIFGSLVEFYANNAVDVPDYLIGEKLRKTGVPLRYMDKPSKDGRSADCWSKTVGSLDVHYSSGVGNHFFYLLAEGSGAKTINGVAYNSPTCNGSTVTGIGNAAAGKIWYRALTTYMTSSTNYAGARTASLNAAADLYGSGSAQYNAVAAAWSAVNVT
ncbi:MAG TPA: M4 family metallopeptidase [Actinomycetes bacterium]